MEIGSFAWAIRAGAMCCPIGMQAWTGGRKANEITERTKVR